MNKNIILSRETIKLNLYEIKMLMLYLLYADNFLVFLIENRFNNFEIAFKEYNREKPFSELNNKEKQSLLKPVYHRYTKKRFFELKKLKDQIYNRREYLKNNKISGYFLPKKLVLYNVPCKKNNSWLSILGKLKINLKEGIYAREDDLYLLNDVYEFDKIEIKIYTDKDILENPVVIIDVQLHFEYYVY